MYKFGRGPTGDADEWAGELEERFIDQHGIGVCSAAGSNKPAKRCAGRIVGLGQHEQAFARPCRRVVGGDTARLRIRAIELGERRHGERDRADAVPRAQTNGASSVAPLPSRICGSSTCHRFGQCLPQAVQARARGSATMRSSAERIASMYRGRRPQRIDAGGKIGNFAPVPSALAADLENVSAVGDRHRITPATRSTISSEEPIEQHSGFRICGQVERPAGVAQKRLAAGDTLIVVQPAEPDAERAGHGGLGISGVRTRLQARIAQRDSH